MSKPWERYPHIWKTQSAFMSYVRGGIRRGVWEKHPIKLQFIKDNRIRVPLGRKTENNPEGLVWGCECYLCKKLFRQSDCQVDHITGNHSLRSMDDLQDFIQAMLFVTEDDLALVCKPCHTVKSYSEKQGITFEEAVIEKQVIAFGKLTASAQTSELKRLGLPAGKTEVIRKDNYRKYLKENT